MFRDVPATDRGSRLRVEALEDRATPAGNLTATVVGDVLTLTGDQFANQIQVRITKESAPSTASTVLVTGQGATTVDGQASKSFAGIRSARVNLRDGNDVLVADPAGDLDLARSLTVDLGGGDNTLTLAPGGKLSLGGLSVRAGDGADTVELSAGAAPEQVVFGAVSLALGDGDTSTSVFGVELSGGLRLSTGDGDDEMSLDGVSSATPAGGHGAVTASTGAGLLDVVLSGTDLGTVALTGLGDVNLVVTDGASRALSVAGGPFGFVDAAFDGDSEVQGALAVRGYQPRLNVLGGSLTVAGDVAVTGPAAAVFTNQATASLARSLAVRSSAGDAVVQAAGTSLTVGTNLTVAGVNSTDTSFTSTGPSQIKGTASIRGGPAPDTFTANANFRVGKSLSFTLGAGPDAVSLIGSGGTATVGGALTMDTGSGIDAVYLERVGVTGSTLIRTGAGADAVVIQSDSKFTGPVTIDLGTGDDSLTAATLGGSPGPVTFSAKAVVRLGGGNDSLTLGVAGAANSKVVFGVAGTLIDGGPGLNLYDDEAGQVDGTSMTMVGLTDPTP